MACTDTSEPCTSYISMYSKQAEYLHAGVEVSAGAACKGKQNAGCDLCSLVSVHRAWEISIESAHKERSTNLECFTGVGSEWLAKAFLFASGPCLPRR